MINIKIPNNNIPEREYIIKFILFDYLGLDYNVSANESNVDYSICFDECELIIQDCFFSKFPEALSYLREDALPGKICYTKNEFTPENDIPVIFGSDTFIQADKKSICGIDIFASSFFMLIRWEEYLNKTRDAHNRFPGIESIAFKSHFLHRPIVNEYVEMLWNIMLKLGYKCKRKQRNFDLVLTHDIDEMFYPKSLRILAGDVIKRKSAKLLWEHLNFMFLSNPYDTFDFLMSSSESIGLKSHFYFMSSNKKQLPLEYRYNLKSKLFKSTIEEIKKRGHIIGFHPGYYTYDNEKRWSNEKKFLEETIDQEIIEGRQHYLRWDLIKTLSIWNRNNMKIDSTFGYYDKEGFRCGTGEIFSVFDFLDRRQLNIKERPLIVMDSTLFEYQKYSLDKAFQILEYYISIGKKYCSTITLLIHNDGFHGRWNDFSFIPYKRLLYFSNR
jgi:hypothetical protein